MDEITDFAVGVLWLVVMGVIINIGAISTAIGVAVGIGLVLVCAWLGSKGDDAAWTRTER